MLPSKVIDAFTGRGVEDPISINVRLKNRKVKIYVGFGLIIIPKIEISNKKELETYFDCVILDKGNKYWIVPKIVGEIVEKEGVLSSASDRHITLLKKWLIEKGIFLLKEFFAT